MLSSIYEKTGKEAGKMADSLIKWIECSLAFRGKEQLFRELFEKHSSPEKALDHAHQSKLPLGKVSVGTAESILDNCRKSGVKIITLKDISYLRSFGAVPAPIVLYVKGDPDTLLSSDAVGIIGARHPSDYSVKICSRFSSELARSGRVIISGFASGIDRCAHLSCIRSGSRTVAVLGCGIGCDYPYGSLEIQKEIAASGAVISEYPPYSEPVRSNFTQRNRLIAALSSKLLVVEASAKSGCLNTVSHALTAGTDVFVIPPYQTDSERYRGQTELIREGAQIAFEPSDLL
ncbi:DNA-processing protein DprA [Ruminococcus sp. FC2018]|uniref:DNA-processing protein DprA n=1 Tax=Ruminococcus sp. FC2018 TaxID=1410617 RepID=UPI0009DFDE1F|nr:DNA-processing protein DprA [Ruminococcus sp. FC2018]